MKYKELSSFTVYSIMENKLMHRFQQQLYGTGLKCTERIVNKVEDLDTDNIVKICDEFLWNTK